ncbi:MAG TPA: SRPBCC family protein [Ornithinicoccus sp.]|nr:SRPBCC family protein [Ornithinicoccus sp.]
MIRVRRLITGSPERLWALVCDVRRWDQLLPTVDEIVRVDHGGPVGVGSRFEMKQPGLPRAAWEITAWQSGKAFTWESSTPGVCTTATHKVGREDGHSYLDLTLEWTGALGGVVDMIFGKKVRRMVEQEADTFARLAEGGTVDSGH